MNYTLKKSAVNVFLFVQTWIIFPNNKNIKINLIHERNLINKYYDSLDYSLKKIYIIF